MGPVRDYIHGREVILLAQRIRRFYRGSYRQMKIGKALALQVNKEGSHLRGWP